MATCLFDLDGTLVNTIEDLGRSMNMTLESIGLETVPLEKYYQYVGNGMYQLAKRAVNPHFEYIDECLSLFHKNYQKHYLDYSLPYEGIRELLKKLKKDGYHLAVITNKPDDVAKDMVNTLFPDVFEIVLGGCNDYPVKPDITSLNIALHYMNVDTSKCLFIGDSNVDVYTGKNAHIPIIGCAWGFRGEKELTQAGADFIANNAKELERIIYAWNKSMSDGV